MSKPLISIIVPAYNAEKWLAACCESVFTQSYRNWELILVDDGSRDRTLEIAECEAGARANVKVIHTENGGVCHARNTGLDAARGEYITFLDADDRLTPDALERMYALTTETNCQIAILSKIYMRHDGIQTRKSGAGTEIWEGTEILCKSLEDHPASHSVYAKLYSRELIGNLRFVEGRRVHEDSFFVFQCFCQCTRAAYRNEGVYLYNTTPGSASRAAFSDKFFDILYFADRKTQIIRSQYPQFEDAVLPIQMRAYLSLLYNLCKTYEWKYHARQRECLHYIRANRKHFIPSTVFEKRFLILIRFRLF